MPCIELRFGLKAEEFIDHQEVLDTLAYARAHQKQPCALIEQLIDQSRPVQRTHSPRGSLAIRVRPAGN